MEGRGVEGRKGDERREEGGGGRGNRRRWRRGRG